MSSSLNDSALEDSSSDTSEWIGLENIVLGSSIIYSQPPLVQERVCANISLIKHKQDCHYKSLTGLSFIIDMSLLSCDVVEQVMETEDSVSEYELIGCEIINAAWSDLALLKSKKKLI